MRNQKQESLEEIKTNPIVGIIGVGYVGLGLAIVFSKAGYQVLAYDFNQHRSEMLKNHIDENNEFLRFDTSHIQFSHDAEDLSIASYYLIAVPTPSIRNKPDFMPLEKAAMTVGSYVKLGDVVVVVSTVSPGATEEIVIPILEKQSSLKSGVDFFVGFCPEKINPGDAEHCINHVIQVISGQNEQALQQIETLYQKALPGQIHRATSIKVAEATKLLENIQRDVNIALMNEYAEIMDEMNISIHDVLDAASTKWNFLPFQPGLVGGHCIPIDPYYLIEYAKKIGHQAPLIATARAVNENFVSYVANKLIQLLNHQTCPTYQVKIALLGLSFKANVSDTRHSLTISLNQLLRSKGLDVYVCDPLAKNEALQDHQRVDWDSLPVCDAIILIQKHQPFIEQGLDDLCSKLTKQGVFFDLTGSFSKVVPARDDVCYWSL